MSAPEDNVVLQEMEKLAAILTGRHGHACMIAALNSRKFEELGSSASLGLVAARHQIELASLLIGTVLVMIRTAETQQWDDFAEGLKEILAELSERWPQLSTKPGWES